MTRRLLLVPLVAMLVALLAACGSDSQTRETPQGLETVIEAYEALTDLYIEKDTLSEEELSDAAIRGMLDSLDDPYSSFLTPDQFALTSDFSGQFEGIGAEVTVRDRQIIILAPLPDSPAIAAGIRPGDLILSVDGEPLEDKSLLEAVLLIRGPKGTPVTLEVVHEGATVSTLITIVRDTIVLTSVESELLEAGIGYLAISNFEELTARQVQEAVDDLRRQGARGLVVDLRNNPGGLLSSAIDVTSVFLNGGLILSTVDGDGNRTEFGATSGGAAADMPLVVLVNGFTASASEILTGALQDRSRATIVGTRTFGKGSVTLLAPLSTGAGLNFTISHWFTPNDTLIEGNGLEPDVLVGRDGALPRTDAVRRLQGLVPSLCAAFDDAEDDLAERPDLLDPLDQLCNRAVPAPDPDGDDVQLDRAVQVLKGLL